MMGSKAMGGDSRFVREASTTAPRAPEPFRLRADRLLRCRSMRSRSARAGFLAGGLGRSDGLYALVVPVDAKDRRFRQAELASDDPDSVVAPLVREQGPLDDLWRRPGCGCGSVVRIG